MRRRRQANKVARSTRTSALGSEVAVKVDHRARHGVEVSNFNSSFYSPADNLARSISEALDPSKASGTCRALSAEDRARIEARLNGRAS